jgi:hypothetical protein
MKIVNEKILDTKSSRWHGIQINPANVSPKIGNTDMTEADLGVRGDL